MFEISSRIFLWEQVTAKSVGQARKWLHSDALRRAGTDLSSMTLWFFLFFSSKLRISKRDQVGLAHLARIFGISGVATVVAYALPFWCFYRNTRTCTKTTLSLL